MAKGRPTNADTAYKIIVHANGKYRYASTKQYTLGEDGKKTYSYKHWGTVDDKNKFHPGQNFFLAPPAERRKLIFPSGWDLSGASGLSEKKPRGRVAYEADDVDRQYGATWFLDQVAEQTGVREDLQTVFGGNTEIVDDILTMAYYPFLDNLSYNHLSQWQREVKAPSERRLTSTAITRLAQSITEQNRMDLFRQRARRVGKDELCAVDSTSISTYGFNLVDGHRLFAHLPHAHLLPGAPGEHAGQPDGGADTHGAGARGLQEPRPHHRQGLRVAEEPRAVHSARAEDHHQREGLAGRAAQAHQVPGHGQGLPRGDVRGPQGGHLLHAARCEYSVKGNGDNVIEARKYKLNLYFNPFKRAEDQLEMEQAAAEQSQLMDGIVKDGSPVEDVDATARRFNLLSINFGKDKSVRSYEVNRDKMEAMMLTSGFFASKTFGVDFDPLKAKDNYGMRDEQEKMIGLQKGPLGQDRLRTWSETAKRGRMFVCFIGLILASYVRSVHQSSKYLSEKFAAVEDILAEMRTIRCIEHKGRMKFITPFVGAQVEICREFGLDIPEKCAPTYVSKKKSVTPKRGRPAKPKTVTQEF